MTNKLFERYEIKNGANLEFFFDYKEDSPIDTVVKINRIEEI